MSAETQPREALIGKDSQSTNGLQTGHDSLTHGESQAQVVTVLHPNLHQDKIESAKLIARSALLLLQQNSHLSNTNQTIQCEVVDRVLKLKGSLPSFFLKQLAQESLRALEGVDRIENRIVVDSFDATESDRLSEAGEQSESIVSEPAKPR